MTTFDEWCAEIWEKNPDIYIDPMLRSRFDDRRGYKDRWRTQTLSWAMGKPYHNKIDGECCMDFSCCFPDMFTEDKDERWEYYRLKFGSDAPKETIQERSARTAPERTKRHNKAMRGISSGSDTPSVGEQVIEGLKDAIASSSETPETTSDSGANSDEPQNPSNKG